MKEVAGLGYRLNFLSLSGRGLRDSCAEETITDNNKKDNMGRILFNYSNLLLFINNRFFFSDVQRKSPMGQKLLITRLINIDNI